jgi:hypothetical protein
LCKARETVDVEILSVLAISLIVGNLFVDMFVPGSSMC